MKEDMTKNVRSAPHKQARKPEARVEKLIAEDLLVGRNAVSEALRSQRSLNKLLVQDGAHGGSLAELLALAKAKAVPVEFVKAERLDKLAPGMRHQGVLALAAPIAFQTLDDVFAKAAAKGEPPFLLLLDELQDPQNVGALIRTADAAGVHGVLMPRRRSCPLNAVVAKISAGAVEYVPVVQIGNIAQAMEELKERGCWVVGADMDGVDFYAANMTGPIVLVIGAEGKGLGRLVKQKCDDIVSLPMHGGVNSLNASNAGAILMYEVVRQRHLFGGQ
ncbi:MAG: 23S rRNA (guanosine(2251)-2'-O)-methyltransferase RlmB [Phascolarctobacterium sp.]|nr:23S rRNA (guanosine(2251)-2'-O)-methyltransferase RlmB [Phascolarctobacterium sp.]